MKKAIIFDLYGTLIDIHTDEDNDLFWSQMTLYFGYYGAHFKDLQAAYKEEVHKAIEKENATYPDIDILEVFQALFINKGIIIDEGTLLHTAMTFRLLSTDYLQLYPYAKDLLNMLNESDLKVILLSNAQSSFTLNELKLLGIETDFDRIYISSDYRISKPDKKFYEIMLEKERLTAEECVYIGNDHTTDIKGANDVGMDSIYLFTNCSSEINETFSCIHKIIPGDLKQVIDICKKWTSKA